MRGASGGVDLRSMLKHSLRQLRVGGCVEGGEQGHDIAI